MRSYDEIRAAREKAAEELFPYVILESDESPELTAFANPLKRKNREAYLAGAESNDADLEDAQSEAKLYEETEIANQKLLYDAGFETMEKSTDALVGLIDENYELKGRLAAQEIEHAKHLLHMADCFATEQGSRLVAEARLAEKDDEIKAIWEKCPNEEWECTKIQRRLEARLATYEEKLKVAISALDYISETDGIYEAAEKAREALDLLREKK